MFACQKMTYAIRHLTIPMELQMLVILTPLVTVALYTLRNLYDIIYILIIWLRALRLYRYLQKKKKEQRVISWHKNTRFQEEFLQRSCSKKRYNLIFLFVFAPKFSPGAIKITSVHFEYSKHFHVKSLAYLELCFWIFCIVYKNTLKAYK